MKKIVIFASGSGSNAEKIFEYFYCSSMVKVEAICCNNPAAGVIERAKRHNIPLVLFSREDLRSGKLLEDLQAMAPDLLVLAGFLWKIPEEVVEAFPRKIINIHPALLPKFGGKGMYGANVHRAVLEAGEKQSGITVHYVDAHYDEGDIIFQASVPVEPSDTPETLAEKVHSLEHQYYPETIMKLLAGNM